MFIVHFSQRLYKLAGWRDFLDIFKALSMHVSCTRSNYKKVFETVRCASRGSSSSTGGSPVHQMYTPNPSARLPSGPGSTLMQTSYTPSGGGPRMSAFVSGSGMGMPPPLRPQSKIGGIGGGGSVYSSSLSFPSMDSQHSDSEFSVITDTSDEYP